jgi:hypothetical protein
VSKARYYVDEYTSVIEDGAGNVYVTRPSGLSGKIHTLRIASPYTTIQIGTWLSLRAKHMTCQMAQNEFPEMSDEDREFLMTGITPTEWNETFSKNDSGEGEI